MASIAAKGLKLIIGVWIGAPSPNMPVSNTIDGLPDQDDGADTDSEQLHVHWGSVILCQPIAI